MRNFTVFCRIVKSIMIMILKMALHTGMNRPHIFQVKLLTGCPVVREKPGKFQTWQKSGTCVDSQGKKIILCKVMEFTFSTI